MRSRKSRKLLCRAASCQQTIFKQIYLGIHHFLDIDISKYSSVLKLHIICCTIYYICTVYYPTMYNILSSRLVISPRWFQHSASFYFNQKKKQVFVYTKSSINVTHALICGQFCIAFCLRGSLSEPSSRLPDVSAFHRIWPLGPNGLPCRLSRRLRMRGQCCLPAPLRHEPGLLLQPIPHHRASPQDHPSFCHHVQSSSIRIRRNQLHKWVRWWYLSHWEHWEFPLDCFSTVPSTPSVRQPCRCHQQEHKRQQIEEFWSSRFQHPTPHWRQEVHRWNKDWANLQRSCIRQPDYRLLCKQWRQRKVGCPPDAEPGSSQPRRSHRLWILNCCTAVLGQQSCCNFATLVLNFNFVFLILIFEFYIWFSLGKEKC